MEITYTNDTKIHEKKLVKIVKKVNQFYPNLKISVSKNENVWIGFRPCTTSGLPIIEKSQRFKNLTVN